MTLCEAVDLTEDELVQYAKQVVAEVCEETCKPYIRLVLDDDEYWENVDRLYDERI